MIRYGINKISNLLGVISLIAVFIYSLHEYANTFRVYNWAITSNIMPVVKMFEMLIDPVFVLLLMKTFLGSEWQYLPVWIYMIRGRCNACWLNTAQACFSCCLTPCIQSMLTQGMSVIGKILGFQEFTLNETNVYTTIVYWFMLKNLYTFLPEATPWSAIKTWSLVLTMLFCHLVLFGICTWLYDWSAFKFTFMSCIAYSFFCMLSCEKGNRKICEAIEKALGLTDLKDIILFSVRFRLFQVIEYDN